jgi:Helix-turn-helix
MHIDEIRRRLLLIRHSSQRQRNQRKAVSINGIAVMAGLTPPAVYNIIKGATPEPETAVRLAKALTHVVPADFRTHLPPSSDQP